MVDLGKEVAARLARGLAAYLRTSGISTCLGNNVGNLMKYAYQLEHAGWHDELAKASKSYGLARW